MTATLPLLTNPAYVYPSPISTLYQTQESRELSALGMKHHDTPTENAAENCCELAKQHQHTSFLDHIAEEQEKELGYVLPVMGELYNEINHGTPIDSVLESESCTCTEQEQPEAP